MSAVRNGDLISGCYLVTMHSLTHLSIRDIVTGRNCPLATYPLYCVGLSIQ